MPKSKAKYFKRVNHFYDQMSIIPAPNRVLIKITRKQVEDLISKEITKDDGTKVRLFFEHLHFSEGYERRFQQNVSVGEVIGVGSNIDNIKVGDTVILDYLVSNLSDDVVGYFKGNQLISILAHTTYHQDSSTLVNGRRAWAKGDFDYISRILGLVRGDKLIPFDPYVFVEYKSDLLKILNMHGDNVRNTELVIRREIIAVPDGCVFKCGDNISLKKDDWFDREIYDWKIAICFKQDIIISSNG